MFSPSFPHHFETGRHPRNKVFLSDEDFGMALDCLSKACSDLLLQDKETGEILLGNRKVHPQPSWWYGCGGRMMPGESPLQSASRVLKRELGLIVEPEKAIHGGRYHGVGAYSYAWEMRAQKPQERGLADVSIVLTLEITPEEREAIRLDYVNDKEYHGHAWVRPEAVRDDATKHPALRRSVGDLIANAVWRRLLADAPKLTDAELGRRMRESKLMDDLHQDLQGND